MGLIGKGSRFIASVEATTTSRIVIDNIAGVVKPKSEKSIEAI